MKNLSALFFFLAAVLFLIPISCADEDMTEPQPEPPGERPLDSLLTQPVLLTLDPSGRAPLSAEVEIVTRQETTLEYTVAEFDRQVTVATTEHTVPILGLFPGQENEIIVKITDPEGNFAYDTLRVTTDPLPDWMPEVEIVKSVTNLMEPGLTLCELSVGGDNRLRTRPFVFDAEGNIRWYVLLDDFGNWVAPFEPLSNGNFICGHGEDVYELDRLGRVVDQWEIPGYLQHHEVTEKPDGNLLVAVTKTGLDTNLDFIVELDREAGDIVREWDLRQVMDVDRYDLVVSARDWAHVNSISYDEIDDALVISCRNQGVVKVSGDNELIWILAPHKGWDTAGPTGKGFNTADFLLTAVDEAETPYEEEIQLGTASAPDFEWPWGQHTAYVMPNHSQILLFDNGWNRNFTYVTDETAFSQGVIYVIDEPNKTVRRTWSFGKELGAAFYSPNISETDYLQPFSGNILLVSGNIARDEPRRAAILEVNQLTGQVSFEARILFANALSDGGGWSAADISYRGERLLLYPE